MRAIVDVEANELLKAATQIWCIIVNPLSEQGDKTDSYYVFVPDMYADAANDTRLTIKPGELVWIKPLSQFKEFSKQITEWIGHNIINYDSRVLEKLGYVDPIPVKQMTDTMILSQLTGPNRLGGHSLKSWGMRFEDFKGEWKDFSVFDWAMVDYCLQDVRVTQRLYQFMMGNIKNFSKFSVRLEHQVRRILDIMETNGFYLDEERAHQLYTEIKAKCDKLEAKIEQQFPPEKVYFKKLIPRITASGQIHSQDFKTIQNNTYDKGIDEFGVEYYHLYRMVPFNPRSTGQIVERMNKLGWQPVVFNDPTESALKKARAEGRDESEVKGSPQVCEENFETLPEDAPDSARTIAEWFLLDKRLQKLDEWFREQDPKTGCIHGKVFGCGAHTMRMTHRNPNMANISRVSTKKTKFKSESEAIAFKESLQEGDFIGLKKDLEKGEYVVEHLAWGAEGKYATDMRACWSVRDKTKRCLVGIDLSGIQLRALAHYARNKEFSDQLISGDIHTYNTNIIENIIEKYVTMSYSGTANGGKPVSQSKIVNYRNIGFLERNARERRDMVKTFTYAYLFGAGNKKVGSIFEFPEHLQNDAGKYIKNEFAHAIKGLNEFKKNIEKWFKQGYMVGLDGRLISIPSPHIGLSIALQSFEAIIMKYTLVLAMKKIAEEGLDALLVEVTHDECGLDTLKVHADRVGQIVTECMTEAGAYLNSFIQINGQYKKGSSWATAH